VPDPRLSVAVLMVEAALQDEHFCERERGMIQNLLMRRFNLSAVYQAKRRAESVTLHVVTAGTSERELEDRRVAWVTEEPA